MTLARDSKHDPPSVAASGRPHHRSVKRLTYATIDTRVAGACGNRTHRGPRSAPQLVLKTSQTTRPNPPPSREVNRRGRDRERYLIAACAAARSFGP